jgi:type IV pilus assembly protein PilE
MSPKLYSVWDAAMINSTRIQGETSVHRQSGFTLIELMITAVIIAILAAVVTPTYSDYVKRGKIPEATSNLATVRVQMEQFFQDNRAYNASGNPCASISSLNTSNFTFSCPAGSLGTTTYSLQADGAGTMAGFTYTLNQNNVKSTTITDVAGWTGNGGCWVTNKGGAC